MRITLASFVEVLAAVCFFGLFWVEKSYSHWVWLLPAGLFLWVIAGFLGGLGVTLRKKEVNQ